MHRLLIIGAALIAVLVMPSYAGAHEGHAHKVMGTVTAKHENHLEVKSVDGKTASITLDENTKILRGKSQATADDLTPGERVVVTTMEKMDADGKALLIAMEVRLSTAAPPKSSQ